VEAVYFFGGGNLDGEFGVAGVAAGVGSFFGGEEGQPGVGRYMLPNV
jgi:hypothetical protein